MAEIETTPLTQVQIDRFEAIYLKDNTKKINSIDHIVIKNTKVDKFNIKYADGETESFYPSNTLYIGFVLNGITLNRNPK